MEYAVELGILINLLLAGFLGTVGQSIRALAGLKKLVESGGEFKATVLIVSLMIGFVSGVLAFLGVYGADPTFELTTVYMLSIIASGYAGTDFIEGFMKTQKLA